MKEHEGIFRDDRRLLHIVFGASYIIVPVYNNYSNLASNKGKSLSVFILYTRKCDLN